MHEGIAIGSLGIVPLTLLPLAFPADIYRLLPSVCVTPLQYTTAMLLCNLKYPLEILKISGDREWVVNVGHELVL